MENSGKSRRVKARQMKYCNVYQPHNSNVVCASLRVYKQALWPNKQVFGHKVVLCWLNTYIWHFPFSVEHTFRLSRKGVQGSNIQLRNWLFCDYSGHARGRFRQFRADVSWSWAANKRKLQLRSFGRCPAPPLKGDADVMFDYSLDYSTSYRAERRTGSRGLFWPLSFWSRDS